MIQRIQSIYLLLSTILLGLVFVFPFGTLVSEVQYTYNVFAISADATNSFSTLPVAVLVGIATLLSFVSIFLFKNRPLQNRLNVLAMILMVVTPAVAYLYATFGMEKFAAQSMTYGVAYILPICSLVFSFLAFKAIQKDNNLIRSLDRIR